MKAADTLKDASILVVEDELVCREMLKVILQRHGANVTTAPDAETAVQHLEKSQFSAVVSDIKLPGMDGFALLERLRKKDRDLPVIIITGFGSIGSAVEAMNLGVQDYITKPIEDKTRLIDSLKRSIDHYRLILKNKALQEQLMESEETFRELFNNAHEAIFLCATSKTSVAGPFLKINNIGLDMLKYDTVDLHGMTFLDLVAAEHRNRVSKILETMNDRKRLSFETLMVDAAGRNIPVEVSATVFTLRDRANALFMAKNISERRALERSVADASERERSMLGRELHDSLSQNVSSIAMLAAVLKDSLKTQPAKIQEDASVIHELATHAAAVCRRMHAGLFPVALETEGLVAALQLLAATQERIHHVRIVFNSKGAVTPADKTVALQVYRIAQEAVANAIRHGKAKKITIRLGRAGKSSRLTVEDDGVGIQPVHERNEGIGLQIMQYRANMIGGFLDTQSERGKGTRIVCSWQ